jgi:hypothetical protein
MYAVALSVQWLRYVGFYSWRGQEIFLLSKTRTPLPIQCVPEILFPRVYWPGRKVGHLHVVPRLQMHEALPRFLFKCLNGMRRDVYTHTHTHTHTYIYIYVCIYIHIHTFFTFTYTTFLLQTHVVCWCSHVSFSFNEAVQTLPTPQHKMNVKPCSFILILFWSKRFVNNTTQNQYQATATCIQSTMLSSADLSSLFKRETKPLWRVLSAYHLSMK